MADLEFGPVPGRIVRRVPDDIAVLDVECRLVRMNIHREMILEHDEMLFPVDLIADVNPVDVCIDRDILHKDRFKIMPLDADRRADRAVLNGPCIRHIVYFPRFLRIIIIDVPCVVVVRPVLIAHDNIAGYSLREQIPPCALVIDVLKLHLFVEGNPEPAVLHLRCRCAESSAFFGRYSAFRLCGALLRIPYFECLISLGRNILRAENISLFCLLHALFSSAIEDTSYLSSLRSPECHNRWDRPRIRIEDDERSCRRSYSLCNVRERLLLQRPVFCQQLLIFLL